MRHLVFCRLPGRRRAHHLAITRLAPGLKTFSHDHDFPELFLVTSGSGIHHWNGLDTALARGDLVGIRAMDTHHFTSAPDLPLQFINLAIARDWWAGFLKLLSPADADRWTAGRTAPIQRSLDEPTAARSEEAFHDLAVSRGDDATCLTAVAASLVRELFSANVRRPFDRTRLTGLGHAPPWLARMCADLDDPALAAQPLSFWQQRSGRTPEHMSRACRKHLGMVPTELINRARIEHVKTRLLRGDDKIAFLADEAGFQNLGYFYRVFRRYAGTTPAAWLATHQESAVVPR